MNTLNPKVVAVITAVVVALALVVIYKATIGNRPGAPPPIAAAGMSTGQLALPGKDTVGNGPGGSTMGQSGNILPGGGAAPGGGGMAPGGGGMTTPGAPGGGMTLPGAPQGR